MTSHSPPAESQPHGVRAVVRSWAKRAFRTSSRSRPSSPRSGGQATLPAGGTSPSPPPDTTSSQTNITPTLNLDDALAQFVVPSPTSNIVRTADMGPRPDDNVKKTKKSTWDGIRAALRGLETSAYTLPPLQSAIASFATCLDMLETAAESREVYQDLESDLKTMTDTLNRYTNEFGSADPSGNIANITLSIEKEVEFIKKKQARSHSKRVLESDRDTDDMMQCHRRVKALFRQLLESNISIQVLRDAEDRFAENLLHALFPVDDARFNSSYSEMIERRGCTAQTRHALQTDLHEWAKDQNAAKVYWMSGIAGTGKTTIAYSLCEWLNANQQLGASFFCSRIKDSCSDVSRIVPTIASQLAGYSRSFRVALCKILKDDPEISSLNVTDQFKKLVQRPMEEAKVKEEMLADAVVVIEALDECKDGGGTQLILPMLLNLGKDLPMRFFVTSRPEPTVQDEMSSPSSDSPGICSLHVTHLHDIKESIVEEDIKTYLTEALGFMSPRPSWKDIQLLTKRSRKLFIYVATVVRYLQATDISIDTNTRLQTVLAIDSISLTMDGRNSDYGELDKLYDTILGTAFGTQLEPHEIESRRLILRMVAYSREIMTIQTLASVLGHTEQQVMSTLCALQPVLHLPEGKETVSALHTSFTEYLLDKSRSGGLQWHCNVIQTPQKSLPERTEHFGANLQSKGMSALQMFQCLLNHGCPDLTPAVDPSRFSSSLITGGSFGDIWKGRLYDGTSVAVKVWRFASINQDGEKTLKRAMRELYNWSKTDHENVHKLLGVIMFQDRLGMVSRWMDHGNLREYIGKNEFVDRYQLCIQVARGIHYLHNKSMVHGDLKACNILVSSEAVLKLTDFDHSIISDCSLIFSETTQMGGGTLRWMAPELVIETPHPNQRNKRTDIYALGMTLLEVITGTIPYYRQCRTDANVYAKLGQKILPERTHHFQNQRGDRMWALLVRCWDHDPAARPTASEVLEELQLLVKETTPMASEV